MAPFVESFTIPVFTSSLPISPPSYEFANKSTAFYNNSEYFFSSSLSMNKMMRRRLAALYCLCVAQPCAATAASAATATKSTVAAQQTVKYAGNQTELLDAIGNDTTAILTGNIDLEYSMDIQSSDTGIVIENVQGFVIDGAGFAINGRGSMRCLYVGGSGTTVELRNLTVTNGSSTGSSTNGGGIYVDQGAAATLTTSPVTGNTAAFVSVP